MTTGCCCSTTGCPGIAPGPGGLCPQCRTQAMPPDARRLIRQVIVAVLGPPELAGVDLFGSCRLARDSLARQRAPEPEAGS